MTPGAELGSELEGHTLIGGETPSALVNQDEDPSVLSYASANQSFADEPEDHEMSDHQEHERQVVNENLMPPGDSGDSGAQSGSLLSTIGRSGDDGSLSAQRDTIKHSATPNSSSESWRDLLNRLRNGPSEPGESLVTSEDDNGEANNSEDDNSEDNQTPQRLEDSLQHSYLDLNFSPLDSPRASKPRSPTPISAQQDAQSQKQTPFPSLFKTESPAASTRSKLSQRMHESKPTSQIPASQTSEVIDLTSSPRGSPEPSSNSNPSQRSKSALYGNSQPEVTTPRSSVRPSRVSTGRLQHMVEVSISPSSQKKKRSSRKF
jgi:hypothetical protein